MTDLEDKIIDLEARIEELEAKGADETKSEARRAADSGYMIGTVLATILSWSRSASILWCIFHGVLSWIYVIYFVFTR